MIVVTADHLSKSVRPVDAQPESSEIKPKPTRPRGPLRHPTDADLIAFCEENESHVLATISFDGAEIAGKTSFDTLFKLINWRGGNEIYVPGTALENQSLVRVVGKEEAATIRAIFERGRLLLPTKERIRRLYVRAKALELLDQGYTRTAVARALGIHVRSVSRYRASR